MAPIFLIRYKIHYKFYFIHLYYIIYIYIHIYVYILFELVVGAHLVHKQLGPDTCITNKQVVVS